MLGFSGAGTRETRATLARPATPRGPMHFAMARIWPNPPALKIHGRCLMQKFDEANSSTTNGRSVSRGQRRARAARSPAPRRAVPARGRSTPLKRCNFNWPTQWRAYDEGVLTRWIARVNFAWAEVAGHHVACLGNIASTDPAAVFSV